MGATRARRERIDRLLVDRGLCETRARAQALIVAGKVIAGDARIDKPGTRVSVDAPLRLLGQDHPYVSRGGVKLRGALDAFSRSGLDVADRIAIDVGASTGGFTDCLLQAGVARVHAVDVGYGQLAWSLARDERVKLHDRRNIRTLDPAEIGEPASLMVIDCSFIALVKVLEHVPRFLASSADVVALVKPQFELEPERVGKGGIVRNESDRREAMDRVIRAARRLGFEVRGTSESVLQGRDGNVESFVWLVWSGPHAG